MTPDDQGGLDRPRWYVWVNRNDQPLVKLLRNENPAVLNVLEDAETWADALTTLVSQGATDEEIWAGDWLRFLPIPGRRHLVSTLAELRGEGPTDYARGKIPKIAALYRSTKRPTRARIAELSGVDRDTIADWIKRGWMTWPPA